MPDWQIVIQWSVTGMVALGLILALPGLALRAIRFVRFRKLAAASFYLNVPCDSRLSISLLEASHLEFVMLSMPYSSSVLCGTIAVFRNAEILGQTTLPERWESNLNGAWWNSSFKTESRAVIVPIRKHVKAGPIDIGLKLDSNISSERLANRVGFENFARAEIALHGRLA